VCVCLCLSSKYTHTHMHIYAPILEHTSVSTISINAHNLTEPLCCMCILRACVCLQVLAQKAGICNEEVFLVLVVATWLTMIFSCLLQVIYTCIRIYTYRKRRSVCGADSIHCDVLLFTVRLNMSIYIYIIYTSVCINNSIQIYK